MGGFSRWFGATGGLFIQICSGTAYAFGCYSKELKDVMGFSQAEALKISSIGNIGMYIGIIGGLVYDRVGPRWTCSLGALIAASGYSAIYYSTVLAGQGHTHTGLTSWPVVAAFFAAAWNGSAFLDGSVVSTSIKNFPQDRGVVLGLIKAFFGLSASMIAQVYLAFFKLPSGVHGSSVPMMLFLAGIQIVIVFTVLPTQVIVGTDKAAAMTAAGRKRLFQGYAVVVVLSAYLAMVGVVQAGWAKEPHPAYVKGFTGGMVAIVSLLILLPFGVETGGGGGDGQSPWSRVGTNSSYEEQQRLLDRQYVGSVGGRPGPPPSGGGGGGSLEDLNTLQMLSRINFWVLFVAVLLGMGTGLMTINNVSQIVQSLDHGESASVYVTILGVSNCLGRMIGGVATDKLKHCMSRPLCFAVSLCVMCAAQLVLWLAVRSCADDGQAAGQGGFSGSSSGDYAYEEGTPSCGTGVLYPGFALAGMAYGSFWSISPAIVSELFGLSNIGANYQMMSMAPAAGGYLFSAVMASKVYTAAEQSSEVCVLVKGVSSCACFGEACYAHTFLLSAALQLVGALFAVLLWQRTRPYYQSLLPKAHSRF